MSTVTKSNFKVGDPKRISIFPNPENATEEAFIIFSDKDVGDRYITREYRDLKSYYSAYWGAVDKNKRAHMYETLCIARVDFAKKMGYAPYPSKKSDWIFQGQTTTDTKPHLA